ncbi:hypothetical protein AZE42_01989 [Rhizopogon vesiculosus]|uniref:Peptidase C15, pyroglutamyl peptidase I-like protein n=1 Tax=Rhizopogon vesiculosus TaxID=180088 RepID=A0A1J8QIN5_9AGAM|nr:hypothetical protein AZE42_01989 [Rhizopogon vesiculosus]
MPPVDINGLSAPEVRPYHVLVTGFGPFHRHRVNPSWLAVKPLHNTILNIDPPAEPNTIDDQLIIAEADIPITRSIHLSTLQVPVTYEDVLSIVPGLHARPPIIPPAVDHDLPDIIPPPDGFDLIFHVGVTGRGPLRMERVGHKFGYNMKDATGCLAPIVRVTREENSNPNHGQSEPSMIERMERARLSGYDIEAPVDGTEPPKRGFGKGYETFSEEIYTDIDVEKLVHHLKKSGIDQIYSSLDAGHYLCDFIYYCSLAESKRATGKADKSTTKVIFLHCPPVDQPLSTEEVTEAIKKSVIWLCGASKSAFPSA